MRRVWPAGAGLVRAICLLAGLSVAACSDRDDSWLPTGFGQPETVVSYDFELVGSPSDEVDDLAEQSLASVRLRDKGAVSFAFLRRRAEGDVPILLKILRSQSYYAAAAKVRVEETNPQTALVTITVTPGPAYTLVKHDLVIEQAGTVAPPGLDTAALGAPVGGPARAAAIVNAEAMAVAELRKAGFPYARFKDRDGLADPKAATLAVESRILAGPAYTFGAVTFAGVKSVDEAYLASYRPWTEGDRFDIDALREFQHRLFATDLFASVTVRPPAEPPATGAEPAPLPVTVAVEEGPPRRVTGGLRYDTDLGPTVRASFEHRNLFRANERLLVQAEGGLVTQSLGLGLRKPQFRQPDQDLIGDLTLERTDDDAYEAIGITGFGGLERRLSDHWRGGLGALGEISLIDDAGKEETAYLLGVPLFVAYDSSNDLLDPNQGARLRFEATPFAGVFDETDTEFLVLDAKGAAYQKLDKARRCVLAFRGRAATILSPDFEAIPATRRLYAGGSGSVRGYAQNFIGPLDAANDPVGGRSALEVGGELRARLYGDFGGVVFTEAGTVSTKAMPDFAEGVQTAAGLGFRYHSPAGPIRLDVAFPLNRRAADDRFQVYFSIGQAF